MTSETPPGWAVYDVQATITAQLTGARPTLPEDIEAEVEALWQTAQARTGGVLFNGQVFSADRITPDRLEGHMTEYRRIVAQVARPALHAILHVRPLAVCGVVRCTDGMVLGRRSLQAGFQPGIWQLPPAGNVDASAVGADGCIDLRRHALRELEEELGVRPDQIAAMQPICLIEHPGSHVLDLGFCIDLRLDAAALLAAHAAAHDAAEYDPLTVVPWDRLAARLTELGETLMPTAFLFLDHLTQSAGQPLHRLDQLSFGQAADGDAAAREP